VQGDGPDHSMGNENFCITQDMLHIDEETMQKKLKDIDHLDLALPKVPMKVLYKLQVSVAQEIQSRARADATNLQLVKKVSETLKITINQVQVERMK
jgi:hypothetical protein